MRLRKLDEERWSSYCRVMTDDKCEELRMNLVLVGTASFICSIMCNQFSFKCAKIGFEWLDTAGCAGLSSGIFLHSLFMAMVVRASASILFRCFYHFWDLVVIWDAAALFLTFPFFYGFRCATNALITVIWTWCLIHRYFVSVFFAGHCLISSILRVWCMDTFIRLLCKLFLHRQTNCLLLESKTLSAEMIMRLRRHLALVWSTLPGYSLITHSLHHVLKPCLMTDMVIYYTSFPISLKELF